MLRAMCMNGEVLVMVCWPCDLENVLVDTRCVHGLDHFRNVPLTLLRRRIIAIAVVLGWRCVVFGCVVMVMVVMVWLRCVHAVAGGALFEQHKA